MARQKFTGIAGLPLARRAVRMLKDRGIFAHSLLSVEHQQLAQRYVIRGLESGGCACDLGRYVTFAGEEVKTPGRTLPRALLVGCLLVTTLYVLANVAYLNVLPLSAIQHAPADRVATASATALFGPAAAGATPIVPKCGRSGTVTPSRAGSRVTLSGATIVPGTSASGLVVQS